MTTLFISHGAPTLAMEPGETGKVLARLGQSLPRPDSILVVSAHWDTNEVLVSNTKTPETIHDFGGFPSKMYEMQYQAPGAPDLANKVSSLLNKAGIAVSTMERGLDHGAWVPLMLMYPDANIPVTQLSIQSHKGPKAHYALGQAISSLQDQNVMILCSGAITHNLRDFFTSQRNTSSEPEYVAGFSEWVAERVRNQNMAELLDYRSLTAFGARAHPHEDHLSPLFVALGAGRGAPTRYAPETTYGILAMDIYAWD